MHFSSVYLFDIFIGLVLCLFLPLLTMLTFWFWVKASRYDSNSFLYITSSSAKRKLLFNLTIQKITLKTVKPENMHYRLPNRNKGHLTSLQSDTGVLYFLSRFRGRVWAVIYLTDKQASALENFLKRDQGSRYRVNDTGLCSKLIGSRSE